MSTPLAYIDSGEDKKLDIVVPSSTTHDYLTICPTTTGSLGMYVPAQLAGAYTSRVIKLCTTTCPPRMFLRSAVEVQTTATTSQMGIIFSYIMVVTKDAVVGTDHPGVTQTTVTSGMTCVRDPTTPFVNSCSVPLSSIWWQGASGAGASNTQNQVPVTQLFSPPWVDLGVLWDVYFVVTWAAPSGGVGIGPASIVASFEFGPA